MEEVRASENVFLFVCRRDLGYHCDQKKGILPIHVPELADLEYVPRCFLPWWLLSFVLRPAGIIIYLSSI